MSRSLFAIILVAALLGSVALLFVWYMSYGVGQPPEGNIRFPTMRDQATVSYLEDGAVSISAGSENDAYRALGYHAGRDHAWVLALLRQTATGRLTEWFGTPVRHLDRFALTLGFAPSARDAFKALDADDAESLAAYAEGVSEALADEGVALQNEFVIFEIFPEPWQPWHSLAVERLIAWLSEPPLSASSNDSLFWTIRKLEDADRNFRTWLHLHGADMSAAWAWPDSIGWHFSARLVYGATALPLFSEVSIRWPGFSMSGVSLLGTPLFPVLAGRGQVKVMALSSGRSIEALEISPADTALGFRHERIVERGGDEHLVAVPLFGDRVLLDAPEASGDSLIGVAALNWPGLTAVSDWPSWRRMILEIGRGEPPDGAVDGLNLFDGDGLVISERGAAPTGLPLVQTAYGNRLFISNNPASTYAGKRLADPDAGLERLDREDYSPWAHENAPKAASMLGPDSVFNAKTAEAAEYLRNWDFRYNRSSIGAVLFDSWMLHLRYRRGVYPVVLIPEDSLGLQRARSTLMRAWIAAVDSLAEVGGSDLAHWRLETFRPGRRYFPVWSYPTLRDELPLLSRPRYAPIDIPQSGHPTTLLYQPGIADEPANSPSHVYVTGIVGKPSTMSMRPDYEIGSGFIARYVAGPPGADSLNSGRVVTTIALTPRK